MSLFYVSCRPKRGKHYLATVWAIVEAATAAEAIRNVHTEVTDQSVDYSRATAKLLMLNYPYYR